MNIKKNHIWQSTICADSLRKTLPESPGVYLFKDRTGIIIYVGKAKNIKKRVLSYFKPEKDLTEKTARLMRNAGDLDFIVTVTEQEALILESTLIKKHMPRYNIILRDDKQYPCLKLDIKEQFPRLTIARKIKKDGAIYFGPYSSASSVKSTLKLMERMFRLRKCKGSTLPKRSRPCINYQINRCLGACANDVSPSTYNEMVHQVRLFLEGKNRELVNYLKKEMKASSECLDYEKAAIIRDQITAIEKTFERQNVVSSRLEDHDIIGLAQSDPIFLVTIMFMRKGYLTGSRNYLFKNPGGNSSEVLSAFIKQYYLNETFIPKEIIVSEIIEDQDAIANLLSEMSGKKTHVLKPVRGEKKRFVSMANDNAMENLTIHMKTQHHDDITALAMENLQLKTYPRTIEGLDISNLMGGMAVGAIVSFVDGLPHKNGYRNFKIKNVDGIDDYGMMAELVERRMEKGNLPDLFLVDGGKGHLACVMKALAKYQGQEKPAVVSIAKADQAAGEKNDKIFIPNRKNPLALDFDSPVLLLLMRIRDEVHRRAISYHRKRKAAEFMDSELDLIPGMGKKRKISLLKHFKNMDEIKNATPEELSVVSGISKTLAREIHNFFNK